MRYDKVELKDIQKLAKIFNDKRFQDNEKSELFIIRKRFRLEREGDEKIHLCDGLVKGINRIAYYKDIDQEPPELIKVDDDILQQILPADMIKAYLDLTEDENVPLPEKPEQEEELVVTQEKQTVDDLAKVISERIEQKEKPFMPVTPEETPVKRGRGRPRKTETGVAPTVTPEVQPLPVAHTEAPVKRGRGRPRKVTPTEPVEKRKPGRPRKTEVEAIPAVTPEVQAVAEVVVKEEKPVEYTRVFSIADAMVNQVGSLSELAEIANDQYMMKNTGDVRSSCMRKSMEMAELIFEFLSLFGLASKDKKGNIVLSPELANKLEK